MKTKRFIGLAAAVTIALVAAIAASPRADAAVTYGAVYLSGQGTPGNYDAGPGMVCEQTYTRSFSGGSTTLNVPDGPRIEMDNNTISWSHAGSIYSLEKATVTWYLWYWGGGKWNVLKSVSSSWAIQPNSYAGFASENVIGAWFDYLPRNVWYSVTATVNWSQNGVPLGSASYGLVAPRPISGVLSTSTFSNGAGDCLFN